MKNDWPGAILLVLAFVVALLSAIAWWYGVKGDVNPAYVQEEVVPDLSRP